MNMKRNGSNVWPYVVMGSAIGGAVGYLFKTESGRRVRYTLTHPRELSNNIDEARNFVEQKAKVVTDQVHGIIGKAKTGIEEGQLAYQQAAEEFRSRAHKVEAKNSEITSSVHDSVDKINRTAVNIEKSVLDPVCEMGALFKGIETGVRFLLGKQRRQESRIRDQRMMGF